MIATVIIIALAVNGLMIIPGYRWLLVTLNINRKPLNCVQCLSFWMGIIVGVIIMNYIATVGLALAASFLSVAVNRWFNNQPVTFK